MTDTFQPGDPKPCPFCGTPPLIHLGKKWHCQLHGEPGQPVIVECRNTECPAKPQVSDGDVYNGGEKQAREYVIKKWNARHTRPEAPFTSTAISGASAQVKREQKPMMEALEKHRGEATPQKPLHYEFVQSGGYDCMTDAFFIKEGNKTTLVVDQASFGQKTCTNIGEKIPEAENWAKLIVDSVNEHRARADLPGEGKP